MKFIRNVYIGVTFTLILFLTGGFPINTINEVDAVSACSIHVLTMEHEDVQLHWEPEHGEGDIIYIYQQYDEIHFTMSYILDYQGAEASGTDNWSWENMKIYLVVESELTLVWEAVDQDGDHSWSAEYQERVQYNTGLIAKDSSDGYWDTSSYTGERFKVDYFCIGQLVYDPPNQHLNTGDSTDSYFYIQFSTGT